MRTKLCWIPFIPITLLMVFMKYMETTLSSDATFMGLDIVGIRYAVIILAPVLLVLCMLIGLFDRKIAQYYSVSRNIGAAFFAFIAAVALMFKSVMSIMNSVTSGDIEVIEMVTAVVGIVAGIAILFMASCHLSGKNYPSSMGFLMLLPALWSAFELIIIFLSYTTVSVLSKDMLDLVCFALISLFLFTNSMVLGSMEGKNPVKRCFIFGMPTVAATFSYTVYQVVNYISTGIYEMTDIAKTAVIFAIGAYALCVLIELTLKVKSKDEIVIVDDINENDDNEQVTVREEVDYLINEIKPAQTESVRIAEEKPENSVPIQFIKEENIAEISPKAEEKAEENRIEEIPVPEPPIKKEEKKPDLEFVVAPKEENNKNTSASELDLRMDQIDKLILEIQSRQGKND